MMKIGIGASALIIIAMAAISVYGWIAIPEEAMIARHWNLQGVADGYSPRNHVLFGMPLLAAGISFLFVLIPLVDPRSENVKKSAGLLIAGWIGSLALLLIAHASIIFAAANGVQVQSVPDITLYILCIVLILVGNFMAKSRSNFFLGVRTPWTLSSEHAWSAANRTGGWLLVLTGLAAAGTGMALDTVRGYQILIIGVIAAVAISVIISYFAWRADPDRQHG